MTCALVIGGGPAGLMAADVLSSSGVKVTVADQMPTLGRKFLMAGKSGLNLTKAEPLQDFLKRYPAIPAPVRSAIEGFGPQEVQAWAKGLGQEVFIGSTQRVFPKVMKASPLLRAWLAKLQAQGVQFRTRWRWTGWAKGAQFQTPEGVIDHAADITIVATGGGSWARLGSDGAWAEFFDDVAPFQPSNCGFAKNWSPHMTPHFGSPIKATRLQAGLLTSRGEWVITERGIEGGGVYEVSAGMRDGAPLIIDLVPDLPAEKLAERWSKKRGKSSISTFLKAQLRLAPAKIALVHEITKPAPPKATSDWCKLLKALPLAHLGPLPMDEAISTAGGLRFSSLTDGLRFKGRPGVYCAGEMLDWDAPTGGYLLTACLATGRHAALAALSESRSAARCS